MKKVILLLLLFLIASCNVHKTTLKELKNTKSNYQMSYDALRRGAILSIKSDGTLDKILSEVQPDAAIAQTIGITTNLSAKLASGDDFSAEQITNITESLTTLGERTAAVNILRDALYRLEEHCINFPSNCSSDEYWKRYDIVIKAVTDLQGQLTEQKKADVEKMKAKVSELKETILLQKLINQPINN
jgi:hypothetical protein